MRKRRARTKGMMAGLTAAAAMVLACQERSVESRQEARQDGGGSEKAVGAGEPFDPSLMFVFPWELTTNRAVGDEILLGFGGIPSDYPIFEKEIPADWSNRLKKALRLTEVGTGTDLPYGLERKRGRPEKIRVKPVKAIEAGRGYRVTVDLSKGGRPFPKVKILDRYGAEVVDGQVSVEFFTNSRPMLARVGYSGNHGTIDFEFSEALRVDEMVSRERAAVLVDGVAMEPCADPYDRDCLDHPIGHGPYEHNGEMIELTGGILLSFPEGLGAFSEISLRLPHAIRGLDGSLFDGAPNNRVATLDGDYIVYTIQFADMRETQPGLWEWKY